MSCMIMNPESLAALANAVETRLNCNYNYWGFDVPDSLYREFDDCKAPYTYYAENIYRKLYAVNVRAYNGRYNGHEEPIDEEAPPIVMSKYIVHHPPEYREHGFAVRNWHFQLAKLLDFWLYQTAEDATRNDPLRLAMRDFQDKLYRFIVQNSPQYTEERWGELPRPAPEKTRSNPVYYINTAPGEAEAQKGHADYPEDFPHLRPGEDFVAWRVGEDWKIETTLDGEALLERLKTFKEQEAENHGTPAGY